MAKVYQHGDPVVHERMFVVRVEEDKVLCRWTAGGKDKEQWFDAVDLHHYRLDHEDWESLEVSCDFITA